MSIKSWQVLLGAAVVSSLVTSTAVAQASETFSIDNKALNTNWNFRRIDNNPRLSIWQLNNNDPDQKFDRLSGNRGGILLRHHSTGRCLNAHYLWNGAEMNVWPCDANDPDQNWNLVPVSDGRLLIKRAGTNFCIDTPTRSDGGKVHLWTCDSNQPNQRWRSSIYVPPTSGYRSNIESVLRTFFSNTANTRGENWSNRSILDMWDRISGESAQFPNGNPIYTPGDLWTAKMPNDVFGVYQDLSNAIFGSVRVINSGYIYDQSYFNGYKKWHAGLDIGAPQGTQVKAVISGTTWLIQNRVGDYFMAVKADDGNLWIYGHLGTLAVTNGTRINAGSLVGTVGSAAHLHLEVQPGYTYRQTSGAHIDQNFVREATISPLQAFWQFKNK